MKSFGEFIEYFTISAGMALAISCYVVVGGMLDFSHSNYVIYAIIFAAIICFIVSLCVAELAGMYPSAPGIRTYFKYSFGNKTSLTLTFLYISMVALIAGVESYAFSEIIQKLGWSIPQSVIAIGLILIVMLINMLGLELAKSFQVWATLFLIFCIMLISIYALSLDALPLVQSIAATASAENDNGMQNSIVSTLIPLAAMSIFLFVGFEWVAPMGKSPKAYKLLLPMSMPLAILVLAVMYILFSSASLQWLSEREQYMSTPQISLGEVLFGRVGVFLMASLSLLAMATSFNAGLMGAARLIYAISREGNLPKICSRISLSSGSPIGAIFCLGVVSMLTSLFATYYGAHQLMAIVAASITCIIYAALIATLLMLRKSQATLTRTIKVPISPVFLLLVSGLFILLAIAGLASTHTIYAVSVLIILMMVSFLLSQWSYLTNCWPTRFMRKNPV